MKRYFSLLIATISFTIMSIATLLPGVAGAVQAQVGMNPPSSYSAPDDPARIAAGNARLRQAEQLRMQAKTALGAGDQNRAILLLEQAIRVNEFEDQSRVLLADIYGRQGKSAEVVRVLRFIVEPPPYLSSSVGLDIITRMTFVLALLDTNKWAEAVKVYESSAAKPIEWQISNCTIHGEGITIARHTLPDVHFDVDDVDYARMRAQAHLILGSRTSVPLDGADVVNGTRSMLDHVRQVQAINPRSLDAAFLTGTLLSKLDRFAEARKAYEWASRLAPDEAQTEIQTAVDEMNARERRHKQAAARQTNQTGKP